MHYEEMYNKLFSKISDVIEELILVQQQTEDMFVSGVDTEDEESDNCDDTVDTDAIQTKAKNTAVNID